MPLINLTDGTQLTDGGSNTYMVKVAEEALIMSPVADPRTLTSAEVGEPELTLDATKTALVGDVPTGVEFKVINGLLTQQQIFAMFTKRYRFTGWSALNEQGRCVKLLDNQLG